jgi:hypothetical protein
MRRYSKLLSSNGWLRTGGILRSCHSCSTRTLRMLPQHRPSTAKSSGTRAWCVCQQR